MTTVLLWDIDGTLLTTGRAGLFALEGAVESVCGVRLDLATVTTAGLTDVDIAWRLLEQAGVESNAERASALLRAYEARLPAALPRRAGRVMPNVREILEALEGRRDVVSMLLTGNTRAGARAKLCHYGLDRFFADGAFAESARDRESIARAALDLVASRVGALAPEDIVVIGDTPHDIRCGKAIGARVLAVASGAYSLETLEALGVWWAVESLPVPEVFSSRIGLEPREP